jgi:opacity protein-like surface antigen
MMKSGVYAVLFCFALASVCAAQSVSSRPAGEGSAGSQIAQRAVEITPFLVLDSSIGSRVGGGIAFPWTERLSVEGDIGFGPGSLTSTVGVLWKAPGFGPIVPYLAAGGGVEWRESALQVRPLGDLTRTTARFATMLGGGVQVPVTDRVSVRVDARWTNDEWRPSNGVTLRIGR